MSLNNNQHNNPPGGPPSRTVIEFPLTLHLLVTFN